MIYQIKSFKNGSANAKSVWDDYVYLMTPPFNQSGCESLKEQTNI
jgi:hypothetical protein